MKTCLIFWVLVGSKWLPAFTMFCKDKTNYLNDKEKMVKFDDFFKGLEPNKAYGFEGWMLFTNKKTCNYSESISNSSLRINWSKNKGYLQEVYKHTCDLYTFKKNRKGYLQINNPRRFPTSAQFKLGYYVNGSTHQRVLYMGSQRTYFTEYLPIEKPPVLNATFSPNCDSKRLDSTLLANSNSLILMLSGMHLIVWLVCFKL